MKKNRRNASNYIAIVTVVSIIGIFITSCAPTDNSSGDISPDGAGISDISESYPNEDTGSLKPSTKIADVDGSGRPSYEEIEERMLELWDEFNERTVVLPDLLLDYDSSPQEWDNWQAHENGDLIKVLTSESVLRIREIPAADLITVTIPAGFFKLTVCILETGELDHSYSRAVREFDVINKGFHIECLRMLSDDLVYAVYRFLDEYTEASYLAYVFFTKSIHTDGDSEMEQWLLNRLFFAAKKLSSYDFAHIVPGMALGDVAAVDWLVWRQKPVDEESYTQEMWNPEVNTYDEETVYPSPELSFKSYHYLTDGILCINYSRPDQYSPYTVESIGLNETYEVEDTWGYKPLPLKIFEWDFPTR